MESSVSPFFLWPSWIEEANRGGCACGSGEAGGGFGSVKEPPHPSSQGRPTVEESKEKDDAAVGVGGVCYSE